LIELLKKDDNERLKNEVIHPFPTGHFMVFKISPEGKVELDKTERFHSFEDQPLHWKYQNIELNKGKLYSALMTL